VLDTKRLVALLERLTPRERKCAIEGIELLAKAARAATYELKRKKKS
jgi:hypothetical protein